MRERKVGENRGDMKHGIDGDVVVNQEKNEKREDWSVLNVIWRRREERRGEERRGRTGGERKRLGEEGKKKSN